MDLKSNVFTERPSLNGAKRKKSQQESGSPPGTAQTQGTWTCGASIPDL